MTFRQELNVQITVDIHSHLAAITNMICGNMLSQ
jgi:hypothetical protein